MERRTVVKGLTAGAILSDVAAGETRTLNAVVFTGAGALHLELYFEALALTGEIAGVYICDESGRSEPLARKLLGNKLRGIFKDRSGLPAEVKQGLAIVTMPPTGTPAAVEAALDVGCNVVAEKPGFLHAEDFDRLSRKAASQNLLLLLSLPNRVDPYMLEARRLVTGGAIGKVYGVEIHILADQTRLGQAGYSQDWRAHKATAGGGHLAWLGIHWLDLARYITGSAISAVSAFTANVGGKPFDVEDSAALTLRFENGTLGTLTSGYYLDKGYDTQVKVWGADGWVLVQKHTGVPLQWYSSRGGDGQIRRMEPVKPEPGGIYATFTQSVARACLGLSPAPLTADESRAALRAVYACYRAAESGQMQRLT